MYKCCFTERKKPDKNWFTSSVLSKCPKAVKEKLLCAVNWFRPSDSNPSLAAPPHYGTKPGHFETSKIHFPTKE